MECGETESFVWNEGQKGQRGGESKHAQEAQQLCQPNQTEKLSKKNKAGNEPLSQLICIFKSQQQDSKKIGTGNPLKKRQCRQAIKLSHKSFDRQKF